MYFDRNLTCLNKQDKYIAVCDALAKRKPAETVLDGTAESGDIYLAIQEGERYYLLSGVYDPEHAAQRFAAQFEPAPEGLCILLFGFGDGRVVRLLLEDLDLVRKVIVVEPSLDVLRKTMEVFDCDHIFNHPNFSLFVSAEREEGLFDLLEEEMDYISWEYCRYAVLPTYKDRFADLESEVFRMYEQLRIQCHSEQNTMIHFAKSGTYNEVSAFRMLYHGKNFYDLKSWISKDIPCIIVGSGPSLERNIDALREAKGKALIFCADSAAEFLLRQGILPDLVCTIDPEKKMEPVSEELASVPMVVTPTSKFHLLSKIKEPKILCFSSGNAYYQDWFREEGVEFPIFYGGGSVATNCFCLAYELGCRTIILIGQDLALQGDQLHAGKGKEEEAWARVEVDGYDGGKVVSLTDFKMYLDWYESKIAGLKDCRVINASQGGAKIKGAEQMPLAEAVKAYCSQTFDMDEVFEALPYLWKTEQKREMVLASAKEQREISGKIGKEAKGLEEMLQLRAYLAKASEGEKKAFHDGFNRLMKEVEQGPASMFLFRRMIGEEIRFRKEQFELSRDEKSTATDEMRCVGTYLATLRDAAFEIAAWWDEAVKDL